MQQGFAFLHPLAVLSKRHNSEKNTKLKLCQNKQEGENQSLSLLIADFNGFELLRWQHTARGGVKMFYSVLNKCTAASY